MICWKGARRDEAASEVVRLSYLAHALDALGGLLPPELRAGIRAGQHRRSRQLVVGLFHNQALRLQTGRGLVRIPERREEGSRALSRPDESSVTTVQAPEGLGRVAASRRHSPCNTLLRSPPPVFAYPLGRFFR